MTPGDKELLLKDLCTRIPYGVKILHQGWNYEWDQELPTLEKITGIDERFIYTKEIDDNGEEYTSSRHTISLFKDKPYLFPLSSMTEEQSMELFKLFGISLVDSIGADYIKINDCTGITFFLNKGFDVETHLDKLMDWLHKNHFDYRGLIPKGIALDATGLNIY